MSEQHRQGDVLTIRRDDLTLKDLRLKGQKEPTKDGCCILAEGEATGHAHRVEAVLPNGAEAAIFMMDNTRFLYVPESVGDTVPVKHEEHGKVFLGAGIWEIRQQVEYRSGSLHTVLD